MSKKLFLILAVIGVLTISATTVFGRGHGGSHGGGHGRGYDYGYYDDTGYHNGQGHYGAGYNNRQGY